MIPSGGGIANGGALRNLAMFTNAKCGLSVKVIALTPMVNDSLQSHPTMRQDRPAALTYPRTLGDTYHP
jgi:hypothetical protein